MSTNSAMKFTNVANSRDFNTPRSWSENTIFQLQLEQFKHDERYHPEISRLTMHHRLNHMALHFAKYAGRIADAVQTGDDSDIDRTLTDIAIIALSSGNILNLRLSDSFENNVESSDVPFDEVDLATLLVHVTSASGRMAKACESVDHIEAAPLREEMTSAVIDLFRVSIEFATLRGLDLQSAVPQRLESVRETKLFHGHI
tara:strand:- start:1605 stop:2207 length:603 start_codon:yes stop_codon:yes gene_type:complete